MEREDASPDIERSRDQLVQRLAAILDVPAELLDDTPGINHWTLAEKETALPVISIGPRVAILACLSESLALRGYPPTEREIADAIGLRPSTAHYHLEQLRADGYVTWTDGQPRTLRFNAEHPR